MSIEKVRAYFESCGIADRIREFTVSSATVELAAAALGCDGAHIAKTMSFMTPDGVILVVAAGDARIDNHKYKDTFHVKAKMIPFEQVEEVTGHAPGGVCPFGIKDGIEVYLDESLKRFETVYPAAGDDHSAVRLTIPELEEVSGAKGWVDVCREPEDQQHE